MARILVPYHIDERLDDLDVPVAPDVMVAGADSEVADGDPWAVMGSLYEQVAELVAVDTGGGERPVVISGDCTTSLGTVAGLQRAGLEPSVVWFDAHGDVQTLETTASGYIGGYPLRMLVGYRPELLAGRLGLRAVPEPRVTLVDGRDLDPPEVEYLATAAIRRRAVRDLADALPDGPIYLHLDLDVVDCAEVPGLRYPAPGGPARDAVAAALRAVLATGRVAAFGLACTWYPGRGAADAVRSHLEPVLAALARESAGKPAARVRR
ncbi:MAG TPA: arginase family protein [Pseudonocardiaceae bacterium]|jgi:arginase